MSTTPLSQNGREKERPGQPREAGPSFESAHETLKALGITSGSDLAYAASLYHQFVTPTDRIVHIGQEFTPIAMLSAEKRQQLGMVDYATEVQGQERFTHEAHNTTLVVHPMDGGTGSSVGRAYFLAMHWKDLGRSGDAKLGAKGTDLPFTIPFEGKNILVPVMEVKLLRLLTQARQYANVVWQELLNGDSYPSFARFLEGTTLAGRLRRSKAQTYGDLLAEPATGATVGDPIMQADLPTIDVATGQLTRERVAPGSHGQLGTYLLKTMADTAYAESTPRVHAIYNGDGTNNAVSPDMVGFVVQEGAGIVMVTTTRLDSDRKGGILGTSRIDGHEALDILELAQAKKANQAALFQDIGLADTERTRALGLPHAIGEQPFNTNVALFNEGLLGKFLPRLRDYLGEERFAQIITPQLIENDKVQGGKHFTQLEGALASVILRLNAFVTADPQALQIWQEVSGGTQFLRIINLDPVQRDHFFTPIKYAWDFWMQAYSDHFSLDTNTWELTNNRPGHAIGVNNVLVEDPFYMDVDNLINALGHASVVNLDALSIQGRVLLADSTLRGNVQIESAYEGVFDLNSIKAQLPQTPDGHLLFENVRISISAQGEVSLQQI